MKSCLTVLSALLFMISGLPANASYNLNRPDYAKSFPAAQPRPAPEATPQYVVVSFAGLTSDIKKAVLIAMLTTFKSEVATGMVAIEHIDMWGYKQVEHVADLPLELYGTNKRATQDGGLTMVFGDAVLPLATNTSELLKIYLKVPQGKTVTQFENELRATHLASIVEPAWAPPEVKIHDLGPTRASLFELVDEALGGLSSHEIATIKRNSGGFMSFAEFLRDTKSNPPKGTIHYLGLSFHHGLLPYLQTYLPIIGSRPSLNRQNFYSLLGISPGEHDHVKKIIHGLINRGEPVYFFVPPGVNSVEHFGVTFEEFSYLRTLSSYPNITFVFGAYETMARSRYYALTQEKSRQALFAEYAQLCEEILRSE